MPCVSAPLFRDPIFDGAADPMVIYNRGERIWNMLYTQRRANVDSPGVAYCYGCTIGVAESQDGGNNWYYRGALNLEFERGQNTFWAPEVIYLNGRYHMYVSYTKGVHFRFCGNERILHYVSENLWDWSYAGECSLPSPHVIDACIYPLPNGQMRMWYKNEADSSHIWSVDSADGFAFANAQPAITDIECEGPNVFAFGGHYFMIADCWDGLSVYRSDDLTGWARQPNNILKHPGKRPEDGSIGLHADVVVSGSSAYIFYFTHPERTRDYGRIHNETHAHGMVPYAMRRSSVQAAQLTVVNGELCCNRDAEFEMRLLPE